MRRLDPGGQEKGLVLRYHDIVGKAAVPMDADGPEIAAQVDAAGPALAAAPAGNIGIAGDAVADADIGDSLSDRLDDAAEFVAESYRRL